MKKIQTSLKSYLLPSFSSLIWLAALFSALARGRQMMNGDGDLGRHLTLGRYFIAQRQIPRVDLFSHTMAGQPVTPHEWLIQVLFALAERLMGLNGVILFSALVIATAFWIVYRQTQKTTRSLLVAVSISLLMIFTSMIHWLSRPHIITFLFFALWMLILHNLYSGQFKRWWLMPLFMLVWANLHGAFIAGFVTWFIFGIGVLWDQYIFKMSGEHRPADRFWRHYLAGGGAAFLASLINPSGFGLWQTSFGYLGESYLVSRTVEYMSPNFHQVSFWPFLFVIGLFVVLLGFSKRRFGSPLLFTSGAWLVMSLYSARNIPLFAIVSAPLLGAVLDALLYNEAHQSNLLDWFISLDERVGTLDRQLKGVFWPLMAVAMVVLGLSLGIHFDVEGAGYDFSPEVFPVAAVDWLDANPQQGEMFNYFPWGGYLLNRLWPEKQVFICGQTDFYGEALTRQYAQVIQLEDGWEGVLDQYDVDWAILPPHLLAARAIENELGWSVIYEDDTAVILMR